VFFPDEVKIGVSTIKTYFNRMKDEAVHRAVMVMPGTLTSFAKTSLQDISSKYHIEQVPPPIFLPRFPFCNLPLPPT
jgi:DNA-directed RNA polymerase I, II, and III subunit RPABC1